MSTADLPLTWTTWFPSELTTFRTGLIQRYNFFIHSSHCLLLLIVGPEASVWEVRGCGRYLHPQWKRNWEVPGLCLCSLLRSKRCRGSYIEEGHGSPDQSAAASSCQNRVFQRLLSLSDTQTKYQTWNRSVVVRDHRNDAVVACWPCFSLSWVWVEICHGWSGICQFWDEACIELVQFWLYSVNSLEQVQQHYFGELDNIMQTF